MRAHIFHKFFYGAFKILGLFAAHPGAGAMHPYRSSLILTHDALPPFSSASDSWERAISWYASQDASSSSWVPIPAIFPSSSTMIWLA